MDTSYCKEQPKKQEDVAIRKEVKKKEAGSGNSSTDSVNSGSEPDYQNVILLGPLMRVTYNGLTQSVFILDRVKSISYDCPEKISVDVYSNAICFKCFSSGTSSPEVADFCPTLSLVRLWLMSIKPDVGRTKSFPACYPLELCHSYFLDLSCLVL
jgi:hypothetical protein